MPDPSILPDGFVLKLLVALLLIGQVVKGAFWLVGRREDGDEREAKEATRKAIAALAEQLGRVEQIARENRAVATETRDMARSLREDNIRSEQTAGAVMKAVDKLDVALSSMAGAIRELVGELRSERRAER